MKNRRELLVTKHDGTAERFALAKLNNSLATALRKRAYDPRLAGPLSRAVAMHLREFPASSPPTTDYVFRCVCSVLEQTGLGDVAEDMIHSRRLRESRRRHTRLLEAEPGSGSATSPWRKAAIVSVLENDWGLRHGVARFLAGKIEEQVFALNYRLITRRFLAELVRSEALAWGLAGDAELRAGSAAVDRPAHPDPAEKEP